MTVLGIDEITFGAQDLQRCRQFFLDWGLDLHSEDAQRLVFESMNGCRVVVAHSDTPGLPAGLEPDPTLREVAAREAVKETFQVRGTYEEIAERLPNAELVVKVGNQLRRYDQGEWQVSGESGSYSSTRTTSSDSTTSSSSGTNSASTASTSSSDSKTDSASGEGMSEALKRLLQKREKEN